MQDIPVLFKRTYSDQPNHVARCVIMLQHSRSQNTGPNRIDRFIRLPVPTNASPREKCFHFECVGLPETCDVKMGLQTKERFEAAARWGREPKVKVLDTPTHLKIGRQYFISCQNNPLCLSFWLKKKSS